MISASRLLDAIAAGHRPRTMELHWLSANAATSDLVAAAAHLRDLGHGAVMTYSPKVFLPLTHLCRDSCRYCTFARPPEKDSPVFMSIDSILAICRAGVARGCREALFTLGDKPELRYGAARKALAALGHDSTVSYLLEAAGTVLRETGLLPHINAGVMTAAEMSALRKVSASQGVMLESTSPLLTRKGGAHHGSPDKSPRVRLAMMKEAGALAIPFTSGLLIGIGESPADRTRSIIALRALHQRHGHLQEVIIQNFRAKPGTPMAHAPEPAADDLLRTIALARIAFGPAMNIQAPPNLSPAALSALIAAGINDWGGISPLTPDYVNPEAPWPHLALLTRVTEAAGKTLVPRLTAYPAYVRTAETWIDADVRPHVLKLSDGDGYARENTWIAGLSGAAGLSVAPSAPAPVRTAAPAGKSGVAPVLDQAMRGASLDEEAIVRLLQARGAAYDAVIAAADALRKSQAGDTVAYVVNRNINYTNICGFHCTFCGFSKQLRGQRGKEPAYLMSLDEISRRAAEAWTRGATEVCLQGGIHPSFTGRTYLDICKAVRAAAPRIHIHAFSPLEIWHGAETLGLSLPYYLEALIDAGLNSLPGTAAEILDDEVRRTLCPDKITTGQWLQVMRTAHHLGLRSTATIMFGHMERYHHQARHLIRVRTLQEQSGGFTEFVPLPFVAPDTPLYRKGLARSGPTLREAVLMHAVARLTLGASLRNIQTSWVKMGVESAKLCLAAGANDLGGVLMNESISRAAGSRHGQDLSAPAMAAIIRGLGRKPLQRTTSYGAASAERTSAAAAAPPLQPPPASAENTRARVPRHDFL